MSTASTIRYEGSRQHKRYPSPWGQPGLLTDKTECPPAIPPSLAVEVLEEDIVQAIQRSHSSKLKDGDWPRYVWGRSSFVLAEGEQSVVWEARIVNRSVPTYKAYPIEPERHSQLMPVAVRSLLWPGI